jgi:hypothetical protein
MNECCICGNGPEHKVCVQCMRELVEPFVEDYLTPEEAALVLKKLEVVE